MGDDANNALLGGGEGEEKGKEVLGMTGAWPREVARGGSLVRFEAGAKACRSPRQLLWLGRVGSAKNSGTGRYFGDLVEELGTGSEAELDTLVTCIRRSER